LCVEPIPLADVLVWRDDSIKGREITWFNTEGELDLFNSNRSLEFIDIHI
jgi:hypothetical protein